MNYTIEQAYKIIGESALSDDVIQLLQLLIERTADVRKGDVPHETRLAVINVLQDCLDTLKRMQKNTKTRSV